MKKLEERLNLGRKMDFCRKFKSLIKKLDWLDFFYILSKAIYFFGAIRQLAENCFYGWNRKGEVQE